MPMEYGPREFHPMAACLMFKACHDAEHVRDNLLTLLFYGRTGIYAQWEPEPTSEAITPRDAFVGGFFAAQRCFGVYVGHSSHIELAWEHFQAERMKAAASTEPCP